MIKLRTKFLLSEISNKHFYFELENDLNFIMGALKTNKLNSNGPVGIKSRKYIVNLVSEFLNRKKIFFPPEKVELIFKKVDLETSKDLTPFLKLLPNSQNLLEEIKRSGMKSIIATTDLSSRARCAMEALNISSLFFDILGGDKVKDVKPSPDLIKLAIHKANTKASRSIMIGDHVVDMLMGKAVNTAANIAVLNGLGKASDFQNNSNFIINNLSSIQVFSK